MRALHRNLVFAGGLLLGSLVASNAAHAQLDGNARKKTWEAPAQVSELVSVGGCRSSSGPCFLIAQKGTGLVVLRPGIVFPARWWRRTHGLEQPALDLDSVLTGNVNARGGRVADVLFLDGQTGDPQATPLGVRAILKAPGEGLEIRIDAPPSNPLPGLTGPRARFLVFMWAGAPSFSTVSVLPHDIGFLAMPMAERLVVLAGTLDAFSLRCFATSDGEVRVCRIFATIEIPESLPRGTRFYVQGVIEDLGSVHGELAVTNGAVVEIE